MAASAARQQQCADLDRWQAIGHAAGRLRGATLNAMAADDIESVEVINNPGAQFGNEAGGGPILNLVMRRNRKPGGFGTVNANAGIAGRYNSSVSGSYNEGPGATRAASMCATTAAIPWAKSAANAWTAARGVCPQQPAIDQQWLERLAGLERHRQLQPERQRHPGRQRVV
jgi:hypothetical protein